MPELTLNHIDIISSDIRKLEISFSHLSDELTDHVCCDVENEMNLGLSFTDAYRKVKRNIGRGRLKEIQKETLYAVDTKYRYMKNTMKISGIAGTILLGFAAFFKIQHWPYAGVMLVLGAFLMAFVFMPSALGVLWKETHNRKRLFLFVSAFFAAVLFIVGILFKVQHWSAAGTILSLAALCGVLFFIPSLLANKLKDEAKRSKRMIYILGAAGLIFYVLGLLFKIQHWPLATMFLIGGLGIIFVFIFPWYSWITWKDENFVSTRFIYMVIGSIAIVVPSALVTLNLQRNYESGFYLNQNQQQALFNYEFLNNQACIKIHNDSIFSPLLMNIHTRTNKLLKVINDIESIMIAESEGKPGMPASALQLINDTEYGPEIQFSLLSHPFSTEPVSDHLRPGCSSYNELNNAARDYADYLFSLTRGEELRKYEKLLSLATYLPGKDNNQAGVSLMSGLQDLALLKSSILAVESIAFSNIIKH